MPRAGKRSRELGGLTTTRLVPTASAINGPDGDLRRTNLQHKHTVEELYEMRQILLATLRALSINDHEGIICLLVEARLQITKKPDPLVARLLGRKAALADYKHEMDERLDECLTGALHIAEQ